MTGNSVATGEAAGAVASLAAQSSRLPQDVLWNDAVAAFTKIGQRGYHDP